MDTKACVHVGEYSRGGQSRGRVAVKALDHDMQYKEKLVPGGILEPVSGQAFLFFGASNKTSDFMVDGLLLWWEQRKWAFEHVKQLVINLDNGPQCSARRGQFLLRMAQFADLTGLSIRAIYYPPYHSKYNSIERYWAGLEKSWNGYLLDSVTTVLKRAGNFVWKGLQTTAVSLGTFYEKGVKVCGKEKRALQARLVRNPELQWWDVTIHPDTV